MVLDTKNIGEASPAQGTKNLGFAALVGPYGLLKSVKFRTYGLYVLSLRGFMLRFYSQLIRIH